VVLFDLERIEHLDKAANLDRPLIDYSRDNVFVTPSGMFSQRYLRWATEVVRVERILFSTDYPFLLAAQGGARRFLEETDLSDPDREKIASDNWGRLVAVIHI
jgi:predicted TIM-barrel fold metal-dependent hydrolase